MAFENKGAMAATVVVAASDSLNKAAANYVCDGVADNVEIQAAIDAVPVGGGEVVLLDGNYNIAATLNLNKSNLKLKGTGFNTVLFLVANTNAAILTITVSNVVVSSLTTDGNKDNQVNTNHCIYISGANQVKVNKCQVKNSSKTGIYVVWTSTDISLSDNEIYDSALQGININGRRISVENNIIDGAVAEYCIVIGEGYEFRVIGNHCRNANWDGIEFGYGVRGVVVSGNIIEGCRNGISMYMKVSPHFGIDPASDIVVSNNVSISPINQGFYGVATTLGFNRITISNLIIYDPGAHGINFTGTGFTAEDIVISSCQVYSAGQSGIALTEVDRTVIADCVVRDSTYDGINITACEDTVISSCIVRKNAQNGIRVYVSSKFIIDGCIIKNNSNYGIRAYGAGCVEGIISNNKIYDDQGTPTQVQAILLAADANYITIKSNITKNNINPSTIVGDNNSFDFNLISAKLDLSGVAADVEAFHAIKPCQLVGYTILYTEASSADAGVNIRIGRYQNGVVLDDDYFDISTSELSKNKGYAKHFVTADLTQKVVASGDTITVGTAGGKIGTGEIIVTLQIMEMAS